MKRIAGESLAGASVAACAALLAIVVTTGCSAGPARGGSFSSPPGGPTAGSQKTADEISKQIYVSDGDMAPMHYTVLGKVEAQYVLPFGDTGGANAACKEALKQRAYAQFGPLVTAIINYHGEFGGGEWWCNGTAVKLGA